jgi:hypothetical protein
MSAGKLNNGSVTSNEHSPGLTCSVGLSGRGLG